MESESLNNNKIAASIEKDYRFSLCWGEVGIKTKITKEEKIKEAKTERVLKCRLLEDRSYWRETSVWSNSIR